MGNGVNGYLAVTFSQGKDDMGHSDGPSAEP